MPAGEELLRRLAAEPERAALLLDVDGVLAPIVAVPSAAAVPPETRAELERLRGRYGLVACISGRAGDDARRVVGLDGLVVVGEHGLELDPEAPAWRARLEAFVAGVDWEDVERKTLTATFHYRRHPDENDALAVLQPVAEQARAAGLVPRFGRKVLEIRPPLAANKGTAVAYLLTQHGLGRALYAGDDTTDLDAFRALDELELGVRVAVASSEAPPELRETADVVVENPAEFLELLRTL
jgi:trehalose 6-phosphate phosphatase